MNGTTGRTALILTGGGARAAYQVGVLLAVAKLSSNKRRNPFPILCGTSAGAINAATAPVAPAGQQPAAAAPGDPAKEKLYYEAAFDLIKAKDFDKASQAFEAFLRNVMEHGEPA